MLDIWIADFWLLLKGAVIGLQWALYMHGFDGKAETLETHPEL